MCYCYANQQRMIVIRQGYLLHFQVKTLLEFNCQNVEVFGKSEILFEKEGILLEMVPGQGRILQIFIDQKSQLLHSVCAPRGAMLMMFLPLLFQCIAYLFDLYNRACFFHFLQNTLIQNFDFEAWKYFPIMKSCLLPIVLLNIQQHFLITLEYFMFHFHKQSF